MIVVYGGAQIDAQGRSQPRFPEANVDAVADLVRAQLQRWRPRLVVGAAASGADLVVLAAARAEGIPAHIVLPFALPRFLETSVASRGEAWVRRFTELVAGADVEILDEHEDDDVYRRTNAALVARAAELAREGEEVVALVVRPPEGDAPSMSDDLAARAARSGFAVLDIDPGIAPDLARIDDPER